LRRFYVKFLKEVYEEDGGEHYSQGEMEVNISDYYAAPTEANTKPTETWKMLSRKLEIEVDKHLPKRQCVNYIIDAELRSQ